MIENVSTIVIAFSAIVTAAATVILAWITRRYAKTTDEILKAANKPEILIFMFPSETYQYCINLCIQNIGTGFACDVKFKGDLSYNPRPHIYGNKSLGEIGIFKNGISHLPPGKKIEFYLFSFNKNTEKPLNITVTYKDSMNTPYEESFSLDFATWDDFPTERHPIEEIAESTKQIADHMQRQWIP